MIKYIFTYYNNDSQSVHTTTGVLSVYLYEVGALYTFLSLRSNPKVY